MDEDVTTRLARIEEKLDQALKGGSDHETRLRKLEKAQWIGIGAATVMGGALGTGVAKLIGG